MELVALCGSLRHGSYNRQALLAARELLPPDVTFHLYDGLAEVPPYDEDDDAEPELPAVTRLRGALTRADALLIATPEYNASLPGQLKNALDWASRPFPDNCLRNKPVAVIGASTSAFGAVWAQAELKKVLAACGARVVDAELAMPHADRLFDDEGALTDAVLCRHLGAVVAALCDEARERAEQPIAVPALSTSASEEWRLAHV